MNEDMKLLSTLLDHARRRVVAPLSPRPDDPAAVLRLERQGLVYVHGSTLRLTLPGFARALAMVRSQEEASVDRLGRRPHPTSSRAA